MYILESRDCRGEKAPNVISLSFDIPEEAPSLLHNPADLELIDNVLKVALIPFWGQQITDFKWTDGAKFVIRYSEQYIDFATKRAIALLEAAIDRKANIIVFPEFVCAPLVQCRIGEYLLDQYRRAPLRLKELIFVMAGSGWTNDNNNVMNMFDRCGNTIGEYYKYSKFWKDSSLEGLSDPGKKCTIIDVPGLGRILPSICRDISNKEYTEGLIDSFRPFLLFTSAWSTSVEGGFKNQYDFFAKRYMVTSMLCNCCEANR